MKKNTIPATNPVPNAFVAKYQKDVMGILHCFDRLRLQGSVRYLYCRDIFEEYLSKAKVLCKDFERFAKNITAQICQGAEELAHTQQRPFIYLPSSQISKEQLVHKLILQDNLKTGLVGVLRCVDPCRTYRMCGNRQAKTLEPQLQSGRCMYLYFYLLHPRYGLIHLRLQTWFPFLIHLCLNGHEWLACQMDEVGLGYRKADNRFTWIEDFARAQSLADAQLSTDWKALCDDLRQTYHPLHERIFAPMRGLSYYWTAQESEFSSDVIFHDQRVLDRLFPRLVLHGMLNLSCEQVMRFLGKQLNGQFGGEVITDLRRRSEGVRLKH